jgi:hypothetical protein
MECLPFAIDADLVELIVSPGTPTRSTRQYKSKSVLLNPPVDWTEESITDWLNSIGAALENIHPRLGTYLDADGNKATIAKRTWTPKYHENTLEGLPIRRKPDMILVDVNNEGGGGCGDITWQKVHAVSEVTVTEHKPSQQHCWLPQRSLL